MSELFLSNTLSASAAQQLSADAGAAGADGLHDFGRVGAGGREPQHCARDFMRKLLKEVKGLWPPAVRDKDPRLGPED